MFTSSCVRIISHLTLIHHPLFQLQYACIKRLHPGVQHRILVIDNLNLCTARGKIMLQPVNLPLFGSGRDRGFIPGGHRFKSPVSTNQPWENKSHQQQQHPDIYMYLHHLSIVARGCSLTYPDITR